MIVSELAPDELRRRLRGAGLRVRTGPLVQNIRSRLDEVAAGLALHYAAHPVEDQHGFADFHIEVHRPAGLRSWFRPQVMFSFDGGQPFAPLPGHQGYPLLEWGLNWCIFSHCPQYLSVHSAVLERHGRALLLPAPSGSGKSTLCAALAFRGWRLLSDELAVIDPQSGHAMAIPRPISLKNQSIEVIRDYVAEAVFGPAVPETSKGRVAHVRPPADSVAAAATPALPRWVVLPQYRADAASTLQALPKTEALMLLLEQNFNFNVHGAPGFHVLADLVDRCACYRYTYSRLDDAVALFDRLDHEARLGCG